MNIVEKVEQLDGRVDAHATRLARWEQWRNKDLEARLKGIEEALLAVTRPEKTGLTCPATTEQLRSALKTIYELYPKDMSSLSPQAQDGPTRLCHKAQTMYDLLVSIFGHIPQDLHS